MEGRGEEGERIRLEETRDRKEGRRRQRKRRKGEKTKKKTRAMAEGRRGGRLGTRIGEMGVYACEHARWKEPIGQR